MWLSCGVKGPWMPRVVTDSSSSCLKWRKAKWRDLVVSVKLSFRVLAYLGTSFSKRGYPIFVEFIHACYLKLFFRDPEHFPVITREATCFQSFFDRHKSFIYRTNRSVANLISHFKTFPYISNYSREFGRRFCTGSVTSSQRSWSDERMRRANGGRNEALSCQLLVFTPADNTATVWFPLWKTDRQFFSLGLDHSLAPRVCGLESISDLSWQPVSGVNGTISGSLGKMLRRL